MISWLQERLDASNEREFAALARKLELLDVMPPERRARVLHRLVSLSNWTFFRGGVAVGVVLTCGALVCLRLIFGAP